MFDLAWHPVHPIIVSVSLTGLVYIRDKYYTENWSAFALDFKELEETKNTTRQEFVARLRRKNSGFFLRGVSMYRGVTRHHQHERWQARIGRFVGNKGMYLGTFSTQEETAEAYDITTIKFRGTSVVTNFDISRRYLDFEKSM